MQSVWVNVECQKCGNTNEKRYYVDTLNKFETFFQIKCSCGNNDCEHFKLIGLENLNENPSE